MVPVSSPVLFTSSSISATIPSKSAVPSGWKTIADLPELLRPSSVSSVTPAVLIANRRSGAGPLILRLPVRASRKPMASPGYARPWSCASSRCSASIRFSIGGCVENRPAIEPFTPGGKM